MEAKFQRRRSWHKDDERHREKLALRTRKVREGSLRHPYERTSTTTAAKTATGAAVMTAGSQWSALATSTLFCTNSERSKTRIKQQRERETNFV